MCSSIIIHIRQVELKAVLILSYGLVQGMDEHWIIRPASFHFLVIHAHFVSVQILAHVKTKVIDLSNCAIVALEA